MLGNPEGWPFPHDSAKALASMGALVIAIFLTVVPLGASATPVMKEIDTLLVQGRPKEAESLADSLLKTQDVRRHVGSSGWLVQSNRR